VKHVVTWFLVLPAALVIAGCQSYCKEKNSGWCNPCADIPAGAIPQPAGTHSSQWYATQTALADRDDFVIYQYEWQPDSAQLSPFGQRHMSTLADRLSYEPEQVVIEPSGDSTLDVQRREHLVVLLNQKAVASANDRVLVASPTAEGLHGREAPRLSNGYFFSGSRSSGNSGSGQSSLGGGTGGFGGGSGGGFGGGLGGGF